MSARSWSPDSARGDRSSLTELLAHALQGDLAEDGQRRGDGVAGGGIEREAEHGREAHGAQGAQAVLGEALQRGAHAADQPGLQVHLAAERIHQLLVERIVGHGVDGEVAAGEVLR